MKQLLFACCFLISFCLQAQQKETERKQLFDAGWRFHRGDVQGAEQVSFNDAQWRKVNLPHDWSIEDIPGTDSPFDPEAINGVSIGFTVGGTGWYRKTFTVPAAAKGKRLVVQFDGVYMNSDVWLNGQHLGNYPYGYSEFWYDITDKVKPGQQNVLAVEVKNEGRNSRWYTGSGIYRHVWLKTLEPVHVAQWGTYITTPEVTSAAATVNARTKVANNTGRKAKVRLVTRILDANGAEKAKTESNETVAAGAPYEFNQNIKVASPELWSTESPTQYTAVSEVYVGRKLTDRTETKFGIRTLSFDAKTGFQLNGKPMLLKGGCVHHDNGPLGAKAYERADERRVEILKASGYNAIRCAHNPPSTGFLDACDRLGMLVIDEAFDTWNEKKNKDDYNVYFNEWWQKDVEMMVQRDRNHPSIIMWSTGNEIPNRHKPEVAAVGKMLADHIRQLDPTRPVTNGVNGVGPDKEEFMKVLDVIGYNYARDKYVSEHERTPNRVVYAAESFTIEAFDYWMDVLDYPWVIGDFVWTAYDHIGEASIGWLGYKQNKNFYPWNLAFVGDIDICGWKRPQSYYRDALWKNGQNVSVFVKPPTPSFPETNPNPETWSNWKWHDLVADWNWKGYEGKPLEVNVFSSCDEVELFFNGKSLGRKPTTRDTRFTAVWQVPYQPGELKAVAYANGEEAVASVLQTAAEPTQLKLTVDRNEIKADNHDLSYITVELVDANGVRHPKAEDHVKFEIEGPGVIEGVGNANPKSLESFTDPHRKAWQGRCQVIIKSENKPGTIKLKATAAGMKPAEVTIVTK
ncbi:glycoside hydrolase family 2 TIM barrel-domain containing protein [Botryobacter ruber]|uniref:glycoside hydrolase family 2 TIM barrel-domain containing protein n=1 Tax=Botryobacter ruber TaxID=2171629 RepID=UPI000E0A8D17|nr:glycoside hydrolase family 2 TIM barrel-domain containing protein [Botryobacter ruber]